MNNIYKVATGFLTGLVAGSGLLFVTRTSAAPPKPLIEEPIRAQRIELHDVKGKTRIVLDAISPDAPSIKLLDEAGKDRLELEMFLGRPAIFLNNHNSKVRVMLLADDKGKTLLSLTDTKGHTRTITP